MYPIRANTQAMERRGIGLFYQGHAAIPQFLQAVVFRMQLLASSHPRLLASSLNHAPIGT